MTFKKWNIFTFDHLSLPAFLSKWFSDAGHREPFWHSSTPSFLMTNDVFFTPFLFCSNEIIMVLMINGVPLEEAPRDLSSFLSSYPHFKESASRLCTMKAESIGPHGLVYVCAREFAVTHPHDNKISVMGTDDITTSHIIVIKHSGKLFWYKLCGILREFSYFF